MKNAICFLPVLVLLLVLSSCHTSESNGSPDAKCKLKNRVGPNIELTNQVVFKINDSIDLKDEKEFSRIKDTITKYLGKEKDIEFCKCGDLRRQIWTFSDTLDIETKLSGLKNSKGGQDVEGDQQFIMTLPSEGDGLPVDPKRFESLEEYLNTDNEGIVIAILDTGVDLNHMPSRSLFPNPDSISCGMGYSGWNFVSNNIYIQDDHMNVGHGTLVTKTITSELEKNAIRYQILPLKVFDDKGRGSYWNLVCAMSYLEEVQKVGQNPVHLINASFGGTLGNMAEDRIGILKGYIDRMKQTAVVVTSAGNCHFNTDSEDYAHYPSGYSSENIISVGGFANTGNQIVLHQNSNYGKENIDIAAAFDRKLFLDTDGDGNDERFELSGTSYSAAYITAKLAEFRINQAMTGIHADDLRRKFLTHHANTTSPGLTSYISMGRYLK